MTSHAQQLAAQSTKIVVAETASKNYSSLPSAHNSHFHDDPNDATDSSSSK
jgi:hypothetical protein